MGLVVVGLGLAAVVIGLGIYAGVLGWFGHLPGDVRVESKHVRVYFPLASMFLLSVVLTLALSLLRRL